MTGSQEYGLLGGEMVATDDLGVDLPAATEIAPVPENQLEKLENLYAHIKGIGRTALHPVAAARNFADQFFTATGF